VLEQQEALEEAPEVAQQEEAAFFFAKIQWPLEQLLSRRLEEARARVRSNFMMMWCVCLGAGTGWMTCAQH